LNIIGAYATGSRTAFATGVGPPGTASGADRSMGGEEVSSMSTTPTTEQPAQDLRTQAIERIAKKREFAAHLAAYVLINGAFVVIWAMTGSGFFWPVFPILGWGVGVFFHGWDTYTAGPTEDRIQHEMERIQRR
jgi:hypothetical protein